MELSSGPKNGNGEDRSRTKEKWMHFPKPQIDNLHRDKCQSSVTDSVRDGIRHRTDSEETAYGGTQNRGLATTMQAIVRNARLRREVLSKRNCHVLRSERAD